MKVLWVFIFVMSIFYISQEDPAKIFLSMQVRIIRILKMLRIHVAHEPSG